MKATVKRCRNRTFAGRRDYKKAYDMHGVAQSTLDRHD